MYKHYKTWHLNYKLANKNNATRIINGEEEILLAGLLLLLLGAAGGGAVTIAGFEVVVVALRSQGVPSAEKNIEKRVKNQHQLYINYNI